MSGITDSWPIVIHTNLKNEQISHYFQSQGHKVRYNIIPSTIIFPKSSIAFLITQSSNFLETTKENESHSSLENKMFKRLEKFTSTHRNCYLLLKIANLEETMWNAIERVQMRFMDTKLQMIFAEKDMSCIQSMITIAQATCKPASTILQSKLKEHLRGQFSVEKILSTLEPTGLSEHDCLVLQQGLGSLRNISQATEDQLLDCSLSPEAVKKLINFFAMDSQ
ncbi:protein SPO16 homolog isoform X2 [Apostichopus japonicus]|uniref:protein SPO16 homolog isoform X2 n=1 Tax=Stichopus japonicus TaxID=307972 RepID=UPI003AB438D9